MNVAILTSPEHEWFVCKTVKDYTDNLIFVFTEKRHYDDFVRKFSYDIGISFMWTHKIEKRELDRATWFNFHPAPLPEYKGRNLCYQAIMNGETEFGATLHYMDENFDTGDIIDVWRFPITTWDTAQSLSDIAVAKSKWQFGRYFPRIIAGEQFERLPNVGGAYYKKEPIDDFVFLPEEYIKLLSMQVRAITYGDFYPKVNIGGVTYKIVRDE